MDWGSARNSRVNKRGGEKIMAKVHHPDAGGSAEQFQKIRKAYEEAIS